ncbi:MAG: 6-bladed beta-propeller [Prevotellaceae bacterium]|jgi:hypothetical protein|nr:6-bladed beta-propeller [Prevotellaceae bacterium]
MKNFLTSILSILVAVATVAYKYLIFLLILFSVSCNHKKVAIETGNIAHLQFENPKDAALKTPPIYKSVDIVPLEITSDCVIGEIQTVETCDSMIFVSDQYALYVFNKEGKFLNKIGNKGEGPDEYIGFNAFYLDKQNKTVIILDAGKPKCLRHDFSGKFLNSIPLEQGITNMVQQAKIDKNGDIMLNYMLFYQMHIAYRVITGEKEKKVKEMPEISYNPIKTTNYGQSLSRNHMTNTDDGDIDFIMPLCDTVFSYSDGKIKTKYIVDLPAPMPPREKFICSAPDNSFITILSKFCADGYFSGFFSIFETKDHIYLEYKYKGIFSAYYLGNKNTLKGNYHVSVYNKTISEIPFFRVIHSTDDVFVSIESPYNLLVIKDALEESAELKKFRDILKSLDEEDNPVLFFYHF